jgi:hypothetical protein
VNVAGLSTRLGVPTIITELPDAPPRAVPPGKLPALTAQVKGAVPPCAWITCENVKPTAPFASAVVAMEMLGGGGGGGGEGRDEPLPHPANTPANASASGSILLRAFLMYRVLPVLMAIFVLILKSASCSCMLTARILTHAFNLPIEIRVICR